MKLRISKRTIDELREALLSACSSEIGGILFGEHVDSSDFRIVELTKQLNGGGSTYFSRAPSNAKKELKKLRNRYGNNFERFNYLGEWHSHPNSTVHPSFKDENTMRQLLLESEVGANFLVLMIVRLAVNSHIEISANAYLASGHIINCALEIEDDKGSLGDY